MLDLIKLLAAAPGVGLLLIALAHKGLRDRERTALALAGMAMVLATLVVVLADRDPVVIRGTLTPTGGSTGTPARPTTTTMVAATR